MRLKIVQAGQDVLRKSARPLIAAEIKSHEIQELIESMRETMMHRAEASRRPK